MKNEVTFNETFSFAAAVIEGTIFCAHAGLSPQLFDLDLVSEFLCVSYDLFVSPDVRVCDG